MCWQKVVPVPLTGDFLAGDYVWIVDDDTPNGELCEVDTIQADVSLTVVANLVGDYTTAQNAVVYLVHRGGAGSAYRSTWGKFAISSVNNTQIYRLHGYRNLAAGDGLLIRTWGISNADPTAYFSIIFSDE